MPTKKCTFLFRRKTSKHEQHPKIFFTNALPRTKDPKDIIVTDKHVKKEYRAT